MSRPWTLLGAEGGNIKVSERIPAAEDYSTIRANLERIKKEQEESQKEQQPEGKQYDDYYGCGYAEPDQLKSDKYKEFWKQASKDERPDYAGEELDYSCSGTETKSFYEHMELLLDENDEIISKNYPKIDPRIQRLIDKYGLKLENESLQLLLKCHQYPRVI